MSEHYSFELLEKTIFLGMFSISRSFRGDSNPDYIHTVSGREPAAIVPLAETYIDRKGAEKVMFKQCLLKLVQGGGDVRGWNGPSQGHTRHYDLSTSNFGKFDVPVSGMKFVEKSTIPKHQSGSRGFHSLW